MQRYRMFGTGQRGQSEGHARSWRQASLALTAVVSVVLGAMSAVMPASAAEAFSWSGTPMDASATRAVGTAASPTGTKAAGLVQPRMAPGNPGVPSDPTVLFEEDFENVP